MVPGFVFIALHHPDNYEIVFTAPWRGYYSGDGLGKRGETTLYGLCNSLVAGGYIWATFDTLREVKEKILRTDQTDPLAQK